MGHVAGSFSTRVALSKRFSTFFEDDSEAGQPTSQLIRPSRRCSIEPSAGILISQRWPFSSVRSKQELIVDRLSHKSAVKKTGRREKWNLKILRMTMGEFFPGSQEGRSASGCVVVVEAANMQFSADQGYFSYFGNAGFMWSHGCASDVHTSTCGFNQLGSSKLAVLIATI